MIKNASQRIKLQAEMILLLKDLSLFTLPRLFPSFKSQEAQLYESHKRKARASLSLTPGGVISYKKDASNKKKEEARCP